MVHGCAVVTGAASGIGAALAEALAVAGHDVVLADVADGAEEVRDHIAAIGVEAMVVRTDVSSRADVFALRDFALRRFGTVSVLCNNAGVLGPAGDPLWELPSDEWDRVVAVNVWGVLHGIQAFVPAMLAPGVPAHILNTASMQGVTTGGALIPAYTLSKHAVVSLSESLRAQLVARGAAVGVHVLLPGSVDTNLAAGLDAAAVVGAPVTPLAPREVADAALRGMAAGRFYVFTHPGSAERVAARFDELLSSLS